MITQDLIRQLNECIIPPDADVRSIGWLYDIKKASKINDSIALDSLHEDMTIYKLIDCTDKLFSFVLSTRQK